MRRALLCAVLLAFLACVLACGGAGSSSPTKAESKIDKDTQAKRKAAVDGLVDRGVFTSVKRGAGSSHAEITVTGKFLALSENDRLAAVLIATNWLFDLPKDGGKLEVLQSVHLIHFKTGKEIGKYTQDTGLQME